MRIYPGQWYGAEDRPMSGEFKVRTTDDPPEAGLSMYREKEARPDEVLPPGMKAEGFGLVRLQARDFRQEGLYVIAVPDPSDALIGHAHVEVRAGSASGGEQISKARRSRLARRAGSSECIVVRAEPVTSGD